MIPNHLTSRVSLIAVVAGFAAACGGAGGVSEESSERASELTLGASFANANLVSGTFTASAAAPLGCATLDENVKLPDGTSASLAQENTWPYGYVPFRFDPSIPLGSSASNTILDAVRHYNFMTAARFVFDANNVHDDHVLFKSTELGCHTSSIGYVGGSQSVNLQLPNCGTFDVAVHEIGHRVGLHHEQRRADRDKYILIQDGRVHDGEKTSSNIQDGTIPGKSDKRGQFDIYQGPGYQVGGFDFDSVMLYPATTSDPNFAIDINKPIITRRDHSLYPNPQTGGLSPGDTATLFVLYPPPPLISNMDNTCRTAPIKRSTLPPGAPSLGPKQAELLSISNIGGSATFSEHPSTKSTFTAASSWGSAGSFQSHIPWVAGDFNHDGLTDIAEIQNSAGLNRIVVRTASGGGLNAPRIWADRAGKFEASRQWIPGDFNGDGSDDLAVVWRDGDMTTITVFSSLGTAFRTPDHWAIQDMAWDDNTRWTVGDFDNDGRADLAAAWNDAGSTTITVRSSTGSSFNSGLWSVRTGTFDYFAKWLAGDFTGDGKTDLVAIRRDGSHTLTQVFTSTGSAFSGPATWLSFLPGIIGQPPSGGTFTTPVSTATLSSAKLSSATLLTPTIAPSSSVSARIKLPTGPDSLPPVLVIDPIPPAMASARWAAGDFNDDGRADLASVWDNGGTNVITVLQSTGSTFTTANWSTSAGSYGGSNQWCTGRFRSPVDGNANAP